MKSARLLILLLVLPGLAHAHTGTGPQISSLGWGFLHPFSGSDHLLAILAVGLWAVQLGGRALWVLPSTFLLAMGVGAALGASGVALPFIEPLILSSTLAFGAVLALAKPFPLSVSAALVAGAALFHGQAHGLEMPATLLGAQAALGFLLAAASLLLVGLGIGVALQHSARQKPLRLAGVAIFSITVLTLL